MIDPKRVLTVFISCSASSADMAGELRDLLVAEGHRAVGTHVPYGETWAASLQAAIAEADAAIVILDNATASVYYEAGVAAAMGRQILLLGGGPRETPAELSVFPHVLTGTTPGWWRSPVNSFLAAISDDPNHLRIEDGEDRSLEDFRGVLRAPLLLNTMRESDLLRLLGLLLSCEGFEVGRPPSALPPYTAARVDLFATDPGGQTWVVECKARSLGALVSVDAVQQVEHYLQQVEGCPHGLLVTTGQFSHAARHYAEDSDASIDLWDRNVLLGKLADALGATQRSGTA